MEKIFKFLGFLICLLVFLQAASAFELANYLAFSGRLTDSTGHAIETPTEFVFKLYDAPTDGNMLFVQNETIDVNSGIWSVTLGNREDSLSDLNIDGTSIDLDLNIWLEITIGTETLTPRMQLVPKQAAYICLLYTSPSPRDLSTSRMPSSA